MDRLRQDLRFALRRLARQPVFSAVAVAARSREVGIRMSLGADPGSVIRTPTGEGLRLIAAGIGAGLPLAVFGARLAAGLLYGAEPTDPLVFAAGALALGAVALVAAWLPARRASRIEPIRALRAE